MVTGENSAIWLLNMFMEWIPTGWDSNGISTNPIISGNPGNKQQVDTTEIVT